MTALHLPNDQGITSQIPRLTEQMAAAGPTASGSVSSNQDAVVPVTLAGSANTPVEVAALLNVFTRAPTTIAMTAATLAAAAAGRATIVLGVASPLLVRRWNGIEYRRPADRLADVLRFL